MVSGVHRSRVRSPSRSRSWCFIVSSTSIDVAFDARSIDVAAAAAAMAPQINAQDG